MGKMMDIKFRADEEMFTELQDLMNGIGQNALYMSHYELAEQTGMSPISWKKFLLDPRVAAFISAIALLATGAASIGCVWTFLDEPNALKSFKD